MSISAKSGQQVCQNREHKKIDCVNLQLADCMTPSDQLGQPCRWLCVARCKTSFDQQVNNVILHKIATCNSNFEKNRSFKTGITRPPTFRQNLRAIGL